MKKTIISAVTGLVLSVSALAQDGGYTVYNPDGSITIIKPKDNGEYTIYNGDGSISSVKPKDDGSYTVYNGDGTITIVRPKP